MEKCQVSVGYTVTRWRPTLPHVRFGEGGGETDLSEDEKPRPAPTLPMSRVWRPGQTKRVKIFFAHYPGTLEEKALARVGKKMMTGQLLYGEDVTSALVEDTGDASLTVELIRAIQAGEELIVGNNTQIFGTLGSEVVTESPMGSPTARSPKLTATEQWLRARGLTLADVRPRRSRRRKADVSENQLSFLDTLAKAA